MHIKNILITALGILLIASITASYYLLACEDDWCFMFEWQKIRATHTFEECILRGFPVLESYPRQCKAGDKSFVETVDDRQTNDKNPSPGKGACVVGGCSGELCVDGNLGNVASICIYREEFACYKTAECKRQADGQCGWTQSEELRSCLDTKKNQ